VRSNTPLNKFLQDSRSWRTVFEIWRYSYSKDVSQDLIDTLRILFRGDSDPAELKFRGSDTQWKLVKSGLILHRN
jgi:hypothetical protein